MSERRPLTVTLSYDECRALAREAAARAAGRRNADLVTIAKFRTRFELEKAAGLYTAERASLDVPVLRYMAGLR